MIIRMFYCVIVCVIMQDFIVCVVLMLFCYNRDHQESKEIEVYWVTRGVRVIWELLDQVDQVDPLERE
jgi:hypothetical protein